MNQKTELSYQEVRERLRLSAQPSIRAWCAAHGFPNSYVHAVLRGAKPASARLLTALGLRWAIVECEEAQ